MSILDNSIDLNTFLNEYWQKKPLLIKNAFADFNCISGDELAGLALDSEIESRVIQESNKTWQLTRGPFSEEHFAQLPQTHWTLLVQGVDKYLPEVAELLSHFDFLPRWRFDDVMISYAAKHGNVGPHFDYYDVFLYQGSGKRKWLLTTKNCNEANYLKDTPLRIMADFQTEMSYELEPGDMLYLPPHVGHHGIALTDDCITYSFGYRSYQSIELLDSFAEHMLNTQTCGQQHYEDPNWNHLQGPGEIPKQAWQQAKMALKKLLDDDTQLQQWFGQYATRLDTTSENLLEPPILDDRQTVDDFLLKLKASNQISKDYIVRMAYTSTDEHTALYINGHIFKTDGVSPDLLKLIADNDNLSTREIFCHLSSKQNIEFLFELWRLRFIEI